jgi:hypothetical protein
LDVIELWHQHDLAMRVMLLQLGEGFADHCHRRSFDDQLHEQNGKISKDGSLEIGRE